MKKTKQWPKPFGGPPRGLFEDEEAPDAPVRGPLLPRPVFVGSLVVFCVSLVLTADWFGLLLLNPRVSDRLGPLNTVRVMAALMAGIATPSALLMLHYKRLHSYVSEHNVFFAITFSLSFMLGLPCALVAVFG